MPKLNNPKDLAIEETLQSQAYRFDDRQITELREEVEKGKIKLIIIMDSYDELPGEIISHNLYELNHLEKWTSKEASTEYTYFPKVIFTTRNEIF